MLLQFNLIFAEGVYKGRMKILEASFCIVGDESIIHVNPYVNPRATDAFLEERCIDRTAPVSQYGQRVRAAFISSSGILQQIPYSVLLSRQVILVWLSLLTTCKQPLHTFLRL